MPVYHFTIHAYRSWRPDHPRGYTVKGKGYQPPDPDKAAEYDERAKQDSVIFDAAIQREILVLAHEICEKEGWRLECAGFDQTHTHLVLSWTGFNRWEDVDRRLKNLLALKLNRGHKTPGKRWFVRGRSAPRRVRDAKHLNYLKKTYLPDHPGLYWERGQPLPKLE
jgi:hypothetical protein